jgi:hypothetical protein
MRVLKPFFAPEIQPIRTRREVISILKRGAISPRATRKCARFPLLTSKGRKHEAEPMVRIYKDSSNSSPADIGILRYLLLEGPNSAFLEDSLPKSKQLARSRTS